MMKFRIFKISLSLILLLLILSSVCAMAHPGALDANGGHYNRKTGEYHYHKKVSTATVPEKTAPKSQTVEVYFESSELDGIISQLLMYLYLCACSYYILSYLYNSIDNKYLKYISLAIIGFLLICAFSMAGDSLRAKKYLILIWFVFTMTVSYGVYSLEKQTRILKKLAVLKPIVGI